jgi:hypothetical protein
MAKQTSIKRIERLEARSTDGHRLIADQAYRAGRITMPEREIYLSYMNTTGGVIAPIAWIDTDTAIMQVLRKIGCYPDSVWCEGTNPDT